MDPRRQAVEQVLNAKLRNRALVRKETKRLTDNLAVDEQLVTAANGMYEDHTGLLAVTDRRLLFVDEVGYIPFDPQAANLMFMLVSRRYERASLIVTSNKPFSAWGEIFGDEITAAAMIDRLVHHAEVLALKDGMSRAAVPAWVGPPQLKRA
jgi:hypothetical protein